MISTMASFAINQITNKGSILDFAKELRKKSILREQRRERKSSPPPKRTGRGQHPISAPKQRQKKFEVLFEPPHKCCGLWNAREYNCMVHPRDPPYEYYMDKFVATSRNLERAYRVDVWVFGKKCEQELHALHAARRQRLELQSIPAEQDFPHVWPGTYRDRKRLFGKLCILHTVHKEEYHTRRQWSKECFLCEFDGVLRRHEIERQHLYQDLCAKFFGALDEVHNEMGYKLFSCDAPEIDPVLEFNGIGGRSAPILRTTDWSENQKGETGNELEVARAKAQRQERKKAKVWARMSGGSEHKGYELYRIPE